MKHMLGVLGVVTLASFLLGLGPVRPRRLLSLSAWRAMDADWALALPEEDFDRWMSNAGLGGEGPLVERLALRILAFATDVLPTSIVEHYEADLAEVRGIDLRASRPLTDTEWLIKDELQYQADHSEELTSSDYNYFAFMPRFVDRVYPGKGTVRWSSRCWEEVSADLTKQEDKWELQVKVSKARHAICSEVFGFFTASHFRTGIFPAPVGGQKTFTFEMKLTEAQVWDVDTLGVRIFVFHQNALATMRNVLETALLFAPLKTKGVAPLAEKRNVEFLSRYMGLEMKKRKNPRNVVILNESDIHSGDFFGVIRLDGLDPMLAFGMGSHTGHTTVALWEDGQLYVAESTVKGSYWPTNGIQRTPYRQWLAQAWQAGFSVVHAPLKEEYRTIFDESAANAFFHRYEGLEYGYHALFTGWIDTLHKNYPCMPPYDLPKEDQECLVWELLEVGVPIVTRYIPRLEKPFLLAWNQHVTGSAFSNLSGAALYHEALSKGMQLAEIPAVPEPDGVLYPSSFNNGTHAPSIAMVCDVFVCSVWKAAGLFKEIGNELSCIEQTNLDVYALNVLEAPKSRKASCVAADPDNVLCQLMGDYELHLPQLGQRGMYRHMQEHCPTEPPKYDRPADC